MCHDSAQVQEGNGAYGNANHTFPSVSLRFHLFLSCALGESIHLLWIIKPIIECMQEVGGQVFTCNNGSMGKCYHYGEV